MSTYINDFRCPALLAAVLSVIAALPACAQTFTALHHFSASSTNSSGPSTNSDGIYPRAGLIISGNTLYGTTEVGGGADHGTVFALNPDGTGFRTVHQFLDVKDGWTPTAGLTIAGSTLYGTTDNGGSSGHGTVFAVNTDGTGFAILHSFTSWTDNGSGLYTNSDGGNPFGGLIVSGTRLWGTAQLGGSFGWGAVFALNTDGTGFTNLYSFTGGSDGGYPCAALTPSGSTLYGTAVYGGSLGAGSVFALNTDGTGFQTLHSFDFSREGTEPYSGVTLSAGTLYGMAKRGGALGFGAVFALSTNGASFRILHTLDAATDGAYPFAGLVLEGATLYGATSYAGAFGSGTIFALNTNGTAFMTVHDFPTGPGLPPVITNSDGAYPYGTLVLANNTFYGTAGSGGNAANGTVFSLSFRPQLSITAAGANVILSWPTNVAGFSTGGFILQEAADLPSGSWSVPDPFPPIIVNGNYQVTRPMLAPQISYRLSQ